MRRVLQVLSIVCLVLFLIPGYANDVKPERSLMSIKLGLPFSPWAHLEQERVKIENGEKNSINWGIHFLSWSFLAAGIGCAADWGAKRLRKNEALSKT